MITSRRGDELSSMPEPDIPMLVEGFLGEGKALLFFGTGGIGKSILTLDLVASLTSGEPFLDKFKVARPCKVSYIQGENTEIAQKYLWKRIGMVRKQVQENFYNHYVDIMALDTIEGMRAMYEEIKKIWVPDVIVIDPVYKAVRTGSINDDHVCNLLTQNLDALRSMFNCAIILNHHEHRKKRTLYGKEIEEGTDAIAGSFVLSGWATGSYQIVNTTPATEDEKFRKLINAKDRDDNLIDELNLRLVGDGNNLNDPLYYEIVDPEASPQGYRKALHEHIRKTREGTLQQISQDTGIDRRIVGSVLRQLYREGKVGIDMKNSVWVSREE